MNLLKLEAEEPPSRPQATSQLLSKPHLPIKALTPRARPLQGPHLVAFASRAERFPVGPVTRAFRKRFFPEVELAQWNDWRWQARSRIRTLAELERIFELSDDERDAVVRHQGSLPLGITPYYASLMSRDRRARAAAPHPHPGRRRISEDAGEADDPLGEDGHSAVPGLVHRYPDRVLFLATGFCSTYCRYCTRSRMVGEAGGDYTFSRPQWEDAARLYRGPSRDPRRAALGRRSADALRRQARLSARRGCAPSSMSSSCASAPRCRSCCPARDALADQGAEEASSAVDEPPLHPSRPSSRPRSPRLRRGWPTPAFRSAARPCCSRASTIRWRR